MGSDDSGRCRHGDESACAQPLRRKLLPLSLRLILSSRKRRLLRSNPSLHRSPSLRPFPKPPKFPSSLSAQVDLDEPAPAPALPEPEVIELQDIVSAELGEEGAPQPTFELVEEPAEEVVAEAEPIAEPEPSIEYSAAPESIPASHEFDLELAAPAKSKSAPEAATTEDFISELVAEIDGFDAPRASSKVSSEAPASLSKIFEQEPQPMKAITLPHVPEPANGNAVEPAAPQVTAESLNQLAEVFQDFRGTNWAN